MNNRKAKADKEREKVVQDRLQLLLTRMLKDDDNKYCVDCDSKGPRWVSWNLGIFLCIRCAGIHRNLGVHISKVKSVNLDSWTPIQVSSMQLMGNSRARAVYEANLPDGFARPQNDQALEQFIRAKYERKKYIAKEYIPQQPSEFPDGWNDLIEAEKQKKDLRKLILPSHRNGDGTASVTQPPEETARPKPVSKPTAPAISSPAQVQATPQTKKSSGEADLLGLSLGTDATDTGLVNVGNSGTSSGGLGGLNDLNFGGNAVPATGNTPSSNVKQNENDDFFNQQQQQATNVDDGKMSKDSILALFAKTNAPAGNNMMTNHNSNGSSIFGQQMFPQGNTSGGSGSQMLNLSQPQAPPSSFGVNPQSNPFLSNPNFVTTSQSMNGTQSHFGAPAQSSIANNGGAQPGVNQIQSQFSGLNLGTNSFQGLVPTSPMATPTQNQPSQGNNLLGLWQ